MTLRLYADRKQIPLVRTRVRFRHSQIYASDCADCETKEGMLDRIERMIRASSTPINASGFSRSPTNVRRTAR